MKDPVEVRLPSGNHILVVSRVKKPRDTMPLALFDNLPLYLRNGPVIGSTIGRRLEMCVDVSTHVVNWFIASHID